MVFLSRKNCRFLEDVLFDGQRKRGGGVHCYSFLTRDANFVLLLRNVTYLVGNRSIRCVEVRREEAIVDGNYL